jgi:hypothetical protein
VRTPLFFLLVPETVLVAKPGDEGTPEYRAATEIVRELGSPRFAVREAAAKELLELGDAAIPSLIAGSASRSGCLRSASRRRNRGQALRRTPGQRSR